MGWYPTYLEQGRGVDAIETGWLTSLVLLGAAVGCLASGFVTTGWPGSRGHSRRGTACTASAGTRRPPAGHVGQHPVRVAEATSVWIAVACLATLSQQATFWAVTTEISGPHLGAIFGLMNSMGVPGALPFDQVLRPVRRVDGDLRLLRARSSGTRRFYI